MNPTDPRTQEAVEFRDRLHRASRAVQQLAVEEQVARDSLREARARKHEAQAELDRLIRSDMEVLPLFDGLPTLEEQLEAQAELGERERAGRRRCQVCSHPVEGAADRCGRCANAEELGLVTIGGDPTAEFTLWTVDGGRGKRLYFGAAEGGRLGNWAETDAPDYWPKVEDIEAAVEARHGLLLRLKGHWVAGDGSRVSLDFERMERVEPRKKKRKAAKP